LIAKGRRDYQALLLKKAAVPAMAISAGWADSNQCGGLSGWWKSALENSSRT
jgi:hypothetical protein